MGLGHSRREYDERWQVADDVSPGEVYRRFLDHERRTDAVHAGLDGRITDLAKDLVPLALYQQGERDRDKEIARLDAEHAEDIRQVRGEIKELRERPQMTLGRWVGVLTVVAAFLGVLVETWAALKGAGGK